MMQDPRTSKQALAGLFDIGGYMRDELAKNPPPAMKQAPQQTEPAPNQGAPMSVLEQMDERHGTLKSRLGLFSHLYSGGKKEDYGDADLLAERGLIQKQRAMQAQMDMASPYFAAMQDDDPTNDARAIFALSQMGASDNAMGMMFPGMAPSEDTDIMRTTKAYVDSYNEQNPDKPISFHQGYDIVKNYDAGRRGQQAGAVANATGSSESDFSTFNTAKADYISAFENADVLNGSLANVDRGIEMLANGEVDTGLFNGFIFNTFGLGTAAMGELNALSKNATIDKLMSFKGPTTDFEFSQSEAAAFADIMKGEDVNEGTLKTARGAIERAIKRNATLAESAYGTMSEMGEKIGQSGTVDIVGRNYNPWWQQEEQALEQGAPAGNGSGAWDGKRTNFNGMQDNSFDTIYESMPSGTTFIGPDGKEYTKP